MLAFGRNALVLAVRIYIFVVSGVMGYFWATPGDPQKQELAYIQGRSLYQNFCAGCHDATGLQLVQQPPKLDGLFRRNKLPSGAPATDKELRNVILQGRGIMPPFDGIVDKDDVEALVQYLHTL